MTLIFVYGTLRRDADMHRLLVDQVELIGHGSCQGRLYRVGSYPGAVASTDPEERVYGEVYALRSDAVLSRLDRYEECGPGFAEPTEYVRRYRNVTLQDGGTCGAWVYEYNLPTVGLEWIVSGDFLH